MEKYIYFHICIAGEFERIITRIMDKLQNCGILQEINELRYIVLGKFPQRVHEIMRKYPKTKCRHANPSVKLYERITLHVLQADCQHMLNQAHILYLHSKGVSYHTVEMKKTIDQWTDTMLEGLTMYRHLCWRCLETGADAVGSFKLSGFRLACGKEMPNHFSGNFWWSTSSHIAKLGNVGRKYHDPEMWIIGDQPNVRAIVIDNLAGNFFPYALIPTLEEYRCKVTFCGMDSLSKKHLSFSDIVSIEAGFGETWLSCPTLPGSKSICLSPETLGISSEQDIQSGLVGIVKIIRVRLRSGTMVYFKENECLDLV
jgi:hypothetical protein